MKVKPTVSTIDQKIMAMAEYLSLNHIKDSHYEINYNSLGGSFSITFKDKDAIKTRVNTIADGLRAKGFTWNFGTIQ